MIYDYRYNFIMCSKYNRACHILILPYFDIDISILSLEYFFTFMIIIDPRLYLSNYLLLLYRGRLEYVIGFNVVIGAGDSRLGRTTEDIAGEIG